MTHPLRLLGATFILGICVPFSAHAATFDVARAVTLSTTTSDNAYLAGANLQIHAPLTADLVAAAGTLTVSAPVAGDVLLAGGTIDVERPVAGDVRAAAARLTVSDDVGGDIVAAGGIVNISGKANTLRIAGGTVNVTNGANGPVVIYGAEVMLSGTFNGNVEVVSADKITLAEGTVIHGTFTYNAPQQPEIPTSVHIDGGKTYIGSSTILPTVQQAKTVAVASVWVFFFVRILALVVLAGLMAGLFPVLTNSVVSTTLTRTPEQIILLALLGFAAFIVTPVVLLLLLVSFAGIGLAILLGSGYVLFVTLSYTYAAVLTGGLALRALRKVGFVTWRIALLGALFLFLIGRIPVLGLVVTVILSSIAGGALLRLFYRYAFETVRKHS